MTHTAPATLSPPPVFLPPFEGADVHLEIDVRPGTLLGGPFTASAPKAGCRHLTAPQLEEAHLNYLRGGYRQKGEVYTALHRLAHQHRVSRNRLGLFSLDAAVGANVARHRQRRRATPRASG